MFREVARPASLHVWAYVLLQGCILVLSIVNLALSHWFSYCWWKFGLFAGESFYAYSTEFEGEKTMVDVREDACDNDTTKTFVEEYCPSFCEYIENFEAAGIMMLCFALLAMVFLLIAAGLHIVLICRRHSGVEYRNDLVVLWLIMPALTYLVAFALFLLATNLAHLNAVRDFDLEGGAQPKNPTFGPGLGMGIAITCLYILVAVYGMLTTRKEF